MTNLLTTRIRYAHIVVALITVGVVFGAIAPAFAHPHPDNDNGVVIQTQNDDLQDEAEETEDQTEEDASVAVAQTSTRATWNPCTTSSADPVGLSRAPLESAFDCERFKINLGYTPPPLPGTVAPATDKTFTGEAWGDFRLQVQCTDRSFKTPRQGFSITNLSLYSRSADRIASNFSVYADLKALDLWREVLLERVARYTVPKLQSGGIWAGCSTTLIEERVYMPYWFNLMGTQWRWECNPTSESCGSWAQQRTKRLIQIDKDRNQPTQDQATKDDDKVVKVAAGVAETEKEGKDALEQEEDGDKEETDDIDKQDADKEDGDEEETDDTDKKDTDKDETKKDGDKDKKDKDQSVKITQNQWEEIQAPKGTYVQSATPRTTTTTKTTKLTRSAKRIIVVTTTTKRTTTRTTTTTQRTTKVVPSKAAVVVSEKVTKSVQTTVEPTVVTQTVTETVQPTTTTVTKTQTKTQTQTIQPKPKTKSQRSSVTKINKRGGIIIIISGGRK